MKTDKLRVVFDTSVYVSALALPGSISYKAYMHAVRGKIEHFCSPEIIRELSEKLTSAKFNLSSNDVNSIIKRIRKTANFVNPKENISLLIDEPDNRILECAVECKANLIVSGDRHLTELKNYKGIGIIRSADLLHIIK